MNFFSLFKNHQLVSLPEDFLEGYKGQDDLLGSPLGVITTSLSAETEVLLDKIITAIGFDPKGDTKVLQIDSNEFLKLDFDREGFPATVISFGLPPAHLGLNIQSSKYNWIQIGETNIIFADELQQIEEQTALKKELWMALKKLRK